MSWGKIYETTLWGVRIENGWGGIYYSLGSTGSTNLLENGDFSDGETGWTFNSGWTYSSEEAIFEDTVNSYLVSTTNLNSGTQYQVEFEITEITGSARLAVYVGASKIVDFENYSTGTHTRTFTSPNSLEFRFRASSTGGSFSLDNVILTEV